MSFVNLADNDGRAVVKQQLTADHQQGSTGEAPGKSKSCENDSSTTQTLELKHDGEEDQCNSSGCDRNGETTPDFSSEGALPAKAEDAECEDATDGPDQYYDHLCADYDDLIIEENKIMDQVDMDFAHREKWVRCNVCSCKNDARLVKLARRKVAVERRRLRNDKVASNC